MKEYTVAVDVGKRKDRFVIEVSKDVPEIVNGNALTESPDRLLHFMDIVFIDQLFEKSYIDMVEALVKLMQHRDLAHNADLIMDATGVGEAVVDITRSRGLYPIPLITTGGGQSREVYAEFGKVFSGQSDGKLSGARVLQEIHVPKDDLVDAGALLAQQNRVRVAKGVSWAPEMQKQLGHFRGIMTKAGNRKHEADDEEIHDDLVTGYLLLSWWFLRGSSSGTIPERTITGSGQRTGEWDPMEYL